MENDPLSHFKTFSLPQHATHAMTPRPTYQNRELWVRHDSKTPALRIDDNIYSIEVEICLKRHVGEDEE